MLPMSDIVLDYSSSCYIHSRPYQYSHTLKRFRNEPRMNLSSLTVRRPLLPISVPFLRDRTTRSSPKRSQNVSETDLSPLPIS